MAKILITNPAHDDITEYLYIWSRSVVRIAEERGHMIKEIHAEDVTKREIENFLKKQKPDFVIFHGHGADDCICGFGNDEVLIMSGENDKYLKGKIIYSVTCESSSKLGRNTVKSGTKTFIGFKEEVWCPFNPLMMNEPESDIVARCNMEPIMQLSRSIIKGNTVEESYKRSQNNFKKWLDFCESSEAPYEVEGLAPFIYWNMTNQEFIGNKNATIN